MSDVFMPSWHADADANVNNADGDAVTRDTSYTRECHKSHKLHSRVTPGRE